MTDSTAPQQRNASKWSDRLWNGTVVVLVVAGIAILWARRLEDRSDVITREIAPNLAPAEHIEAESGDLSDFNVLIITTDTTRADHIGCYGNRGVQTPVIDTLASEGILCANAVTAQG